MTTFSAKARVARLAGRQFGQLSRAQLELLGIPRGTVGTWLDQGYLDRVLPRVYAVGHRAGTVEADLMAAILYAGPGAMLSHATAAWWVGLTTSRGYWMAVSTPRRCRSLPGIKVHARRNLQRAWHRGLPVTELPQTLVDYAAKASLTDVRRALAQADYDGTLKAEVVAAALRPGHPGRARLLTALERHMPQLADAKSVVEATFMELCEAHNLPLPELNADVGGWEVDIVWRKQRIAIELDGPGNHRTPAQVRRDRQEEMDLRELRFLVLRYSDDQVMHHGQDVMQEVCTVYAERDAHIQSVPTGTRTGPLLTRADRRG